MQNHKFYNTGNLLPVVALPSRAAVHTALAKAMALQPLLSALQTTMLFAIEGSISNKRFPSYRFRSFLRLYHNFISAFTPHL
ncbi:MAG: hypothetical protein PUG85_09285 [Oscillospiraceae bacterium]|nr:hypothetical protein [Oscillospiraceae bacterium]